MARSCSRPVIGKWRKTWPRSRAFMFNFHYWHRVSCEDNFHNQGPELSGGHVKTEAHNYYYPHKKSHDEQNSAEIKIPLNIWSSEMYKGLAIYIGAWCWPGEGGGGSEALAGEQTRSWLGPGSSIIQRGRGPRVRPGCIHNTHLAHNIIKILIWTLKHKWRMLAAYHLLVVSPTRDVSWPQSSHLARVRPLCAVLANIACEGETRHQGIGEIEKLGICVMWAWAASGLSCSSETDPSSLSLSLLPHLISTIMCNFPNQISNHNVGTTKFLKYAWRWL